MVAKWLSLKVLDRYIAGQFLRTFGFSLLICSMISMAIDFSDKVQNFVDKKPPTRAIFLDYYVGFVLHMANQLMPLYVLIAVVFFTSRMAANSEIISMLNAGMSFRRVLKPYLLAAFAIMGFQLVASHWLVPIANKARLAFEDKYVSNQKKMRDSDMFMVSQNQQVTVRSYESSTNTMRNFRLEQFEGSSLLATLEAQEAVYIDSLNIWRLSGCTFRTFQGMKESLRILPAAQTVDTTFNLKPSDFTIFINQNQELTTPELLDNVAWNLARGSGNAHSLQTEIHRRTADAFTILILTIIGLSMAGRKVRGGIGLHLAMAVGIGALFILFSKFSVTLGANGVLNPAVTVWIPNMIFGAVAAYLVWGAQK
jgi:lipopolysaccharide export system permease protein